MSVRPYVRWPKPTAVGLLGSDRLVTLEDSTRVPIERTEGVRVYADVTVATPFPMRGDGTLTAWNDTPVRWNTPEGVTVTLVGSVPLGQGDDGLAALVAWRDWAQDYGATVGSVGQTSWSILRAVIPRPILTNAGTPPPLRSVIGGRQEPNIAPGVYGPFEHWDMSAAYATATARLPYSGVWHEVDPLKFKRTDLILDNDWPAFASAVVRTPPGIPGPIPRREVVKDWAVRRFEPRPFPRGATLRGIWNLRELLMAERVGARVAWRRLWFQGPRPGDDVIRRPFTEWGRAMERGRGLPGLAGTLAKATGNALWGQFSMSGVRTEVVYDPDKRTTQVGGGGRPSAYDIPELVASGVRVHLYDQLIEPLGPRLWSVHTDGGLVGGTWNRVAGRDGVTVPGGWRLKYAGRDLTYIGPQCYAYHDDRGRVQYVVSGVRPEYVAKVFESIRDVVLERVQPGRRPVPDMEQAVAAVASAGLGATVVPTEAWARKMMREVQRA